MLFHASERKGIFLLLLLITSTLLLPRHFLAKEPDIFLLPIAEGMDSTQNQIPDTPPKRAKKTFTPYKKQKIVELNTADSCTLVGIRGIGPYYASKIIRYRKRLGGFYSINQLKDLKMKYFDVDSFAHLFTVNPAWITPIDLDTMSFKSMVRHPYLEYEDVQMIFRAKNKYDTLYYQLLETHGVLNAFKLKKIKPYFK